MRITLDTNAILALENDEADAPSLRELLELHAANNIQLCVSAIAAAERDRENGIPNFSRFTTRLERVGLATAELLSPPGHWGVTFWDHFVFGELGDTLEPAIHDILFPGLNVAESEPNTFDIPYDQRTPKALNALCDILAMWCHIHYRCGLFITRDSNYHKASKKPRLIELGAGQILTAPDAVALLRQSGLNKA